VLRQGVNTALVVHAHHDLRIVAVLPLPAVGEDKTHTALTNGGDGGDHARLAVNRGFNIAGHLFGGRNIGAVGQPEVDKENGRIR
jgi:hypothetical protein